MKIILFLLFFPLSVMAGGVYKWTDENGQVHFGDRPNHVEAEEVEIREQKTGTMVSESRKAAYKYDARVRDAVDSYKAANPIPEVAAGPSPTCKYNRSMLRQYENEWDNIRRRGYKQSERNYYQDKINYYKSEESISCK